MSLPRRVLGLGLACNFGRIECGLPAVVLFHGLCACNHTLSAQCCDAHQQIFQRDMIRGKALQCWECGKYGSQIKAKKLRRAPHVCNVEIRETTRF